MNELLLSMLYISDTLFSNGGLGFAVTLLEPLGGKNNSGVNCTVF